MLKHGFFVALFWATGVLAASVDDRFATGVASLGWDATLDAVQAVYPNGISYPVDDNDNIVAFAYEVKGDPKMLGIEVAVDRVRFLFTNDKKLHHVFFHFDYSQRDAALYGVAEALGQDYTIGDKAGSRLYIWSGRSSVARMTIGIMPNSWAYLAVTSLAGGNRLAK